MFAIMWMLAAYEADDRMKLRLFHRLLLHCTLALFLRLLMNAIDNLSQGRLNPTKNLIRSSYQISLHTELLCNTCWIRDSNVGSHIPRINHAGSETTVIGLDWAGLAMFSIDKIIYQWSSLVTWGEWVALGDFIT